MLSTLLTLALAAQAPASSQSPAAALQAALLQPDAQAAAPVYAANGGQLLWVEGCSATPQAGQMMTVLAASAQQGLNPGDYAAAGWATRAASVSANCDDATAAAGFDVAFTLAVEHYLQDVHSGRFNPRPQSFAIVAGGARDDLAGFIRQLAQAPDAAALAVTAEPQYPAYQRTELALQHYVTLAAVGDGSPVPAPPRPLLPGDSWAGLAALQTRLLLLGDLAAPAAAVPATYKDPLVAAVRHFQRRHGLKPDGALGPQTLGQLNTPLAQRVLQLRLALERWRWLPPPSGDDRVVVNVPEFRLRAYTRGRPVLEMKIITGRAVGHQTPELASALETVIFRPTWSVPFDIIRREVIPQIRQHPTYLADHDFDLLSGSGAPAPPLSRQQQIAELDSGAIYVRQRPGPSNSLGLIKFDFPNRDDIYMHDTPAKSLFDEPRGDFSHGCIRLENPVGFAAFVLRDQPAWTPAAINAAMQSGPNQRLVRVTRRVQVLVIYRTAWTDEDGTVSFLPDIYSRDAALLQALRTAPATVAAPPGGQF